MNTTHPTNTVVSSGHCANRSQLKFACYLLTVCLTAIGSNARANDTCTVELTSGALRVRAGITDVSGAFAPTDRPQLSADGAHLVYSIEEGFDPFFILSVYSADRRGPGEWTAPWLVQQGSAGYEDGNFVSWFFPGFLPNDSTRILSGLGTFDRNPDGSVNPATFDSRLVTYDASGERLTDVLHTTEIGLPPGVIPSGARLSPDGSRIAFYVDGVPQVQGLYLYDRTHGVLQRLSMQNDHDPVWSSDGGRLYFSELTGGPAPLIQGVVGLVTLDLEATPTGFERKPLDPGPSAHSAEHPAPIADSDVLLLHVQDSAESAPRLAARRSCAGFAPIPIALEQGNRSIAAAERPSIASSELSATFMGKFEDDASHRVFVLESNVVQRIRDLVAAQPCPCAGSGDAS
jgi:hypothetical protein